MLAPFLLHVNVMESVCLAADGLLSAGENLNKFPMIGRHRMMPRIHEV